MMKHAENQVRYITARAPASLQERVRCEALRRRTSVQAVIIAALEKAVPKNLRLVVDSGKGSNSES